MKVHQYRADLSWAGSTGSGYRSYDRSHQVDLAAGTPLTVTADAAFQGDPELTNPEQLLLAAASSCQLLSFLAVAAFARIDVISYTDSATAVMPMDTKPVRITEISLNPIITVVGSDVPKILQLVEKAHHECYIANTVNAQITINAQVKIVDG